MSKQDTTGTCFITTSCTIVFLSMLSNSGSRRLSAGATMLHQHFRHKGWLILPTLSSSSHRAPAVDIRALGCLDHLIDRCQSAYHLVGIARQSYRIMQSAPRPFIRQRSAGLQTTALSLRGPRRSQRHRMYPALKRHELLDLLDSTPVDGPDKFPLRIVRHVLNFLQQPLNRRTPSSRLTAM
jgi:hypothetical protein